MPARHPLDQGQTRAVNAEEHEPRSEAVGVSGETVPRTTSHVAVADGLR